MNGITHDVEETRRLALALLLALGLHAALLLGIPAEGWSLRYPPSPRFDVTLLPPIERPTIPAPAMVVPEPTLPPMEPAPVAPPSPAPTFTPPPAPIPPPKPVTTVRPAPKPVIAARPAPKPVTPVAKPVKPLAVAKVTPTPRAVVKPVAPPQPAEPPVSSIKPVSPPPATVEPSTKPPVVKSPPAPRFTPAETPRPPIEKPPARPMERSGRGGVAGGGSRGGRLDSTALLGQIAGLDAETQQRASRAAREKRVSLADSRSLAGFYAADWARKVTRVGETNFPDAARRLNLSAGPLLDVAIRADGSLRDVRVLRSSGNAELDQAARRIVQLAAPYPPFSPELRRQVEVLRIEAPWRFDPGGRVRVR
jgi:protein TonB